MVINQDNSNTNKTIYALLSRKQMNKYGEKMACVIFKPTKPTLKSYELYIRGGVAGGRIMMTPSYTYERYCKEQNESVKNKENLMVCGDFNDVPLCIDCNCAADNLCDYPVGDNLTCDRDLCEEHSFEIADNLHYCEPHYNMWRNFVEGGGISEHLKNVIAFKSEK